MKYFHLAKVNWSVFSGPQSSRHQSGSNQSTMATHAQTQTLFHSIRLKRLVNFRLFAVVLVRIVYKNKTIFFYYYYFDFFCFSVV